MQETYMNAALEQAEESFRQNEVPVGAVIVHDGEIIAAAHNTCESEHDATCHAEMRAIRVASQVLGSWRLNGCTLYVTMEPCPMCAGAILGARISKVVYGVKDPAKGALGSVVDLTSYPLGGKPEVIGGCREKDCRELLRRFFEGRRSGGNGSDKSPSDEDRPQGNVSATDVTEK